MSTPELSKGATAIPVPPTAPPEGQLTDANRLAAHFMHGARKLIFEELQFASNEMLERTQTEMHLFSELVSKMASAHSVKDIRTMYEECGKHQLEFLRRDCDRLFKHGERVIEATSNLFKKDRLD